MHMPKITVVIPLYNKARHIERALTSVLAQKMPAYEILVIDDGSTDGSGDIVAQQFGDQVKLIRQTNQGVAHARNTGIANATGAYIAFLDADDEWSPHFLSEITDLIFEFPHCHMYATAYQFVTSEQTIDLRNPTLSHSQPRFAMDRFYHHAASGDLPFSMSSIAVKTYLARTIGGFDTQQEMGEDQDFYIRCLERSSIAYSQRRFSRYYLSADQRACNRNVPKSECAYSQRVASRIHGVSRQEANDRIAFCASHIFDLIRRNLEVGDWRTAGRLLQDKRLTCDKTRLAYWHTRYLLTRCQPSRFSSDITMAA